LGESLHVKAVSILGVLLLAVGVLTACESSSSSDVKTGGSNDVAKKKLSNSQRMMVQRNLMQESLKI
jgi:hypothetical protein